jgi:hypothetical protein
VRLKTRGSNDIRIKCCKTGLSSYEQQLRRNLRLPRVPRNQID